MVTKRIMVTKYYSQGDSYNNYNKVLFSHGDNDDNGMFFQESTEDNGFMLLFSCSSKCQLHNDLMYLCATKRVIFLIRTV